MVLLPSLALAFAAPGLAAQAPATDPVVRSLDSLMAAAYPADGPGAAVVVARGGEVLLRKGYGLASVELGVPATPEHVFRIGSITKQFTAVAVLMLAEEGKLSLDDEITEYFPGWPTHGHRITVEHLLTHTSGIRSYTSMPELMGQQQRDVELPALIAAFRDQPMDFAPGSDFRYNNSGYVLLGALVERLSGQEYADFLRTRIFEPLGMRDTRYEGQELIPGRVPGHRVHAPGDVRPARYLSMTLPHAAGALVSTVDDQLRWQRAVAEGRLLRPESWRRAFTAFRLADGRSAGYGHGWFLGTAAGEGSVEHGGDINGFSSDGLWLPGAGLHVVVLSNVERGYANPGALTQAIAQRVLGTTGQAPGAALSPAKLDEYVGAYEASETERRVVTRDGETLYTVRGVSPRQELRPLGEDRFVYPESGTRVTFTRGANGRVDAMRLHPRIGPEPLPSRRLSDDPTAAAAVAAIELPAEVLDRYAGRYQLTPEIVVDVRREGAGLVAQPTGQSARPLAARSMVRFTVEGVSGAAVEFAADGSSLVFEQGGNRMTAPRIP